jgi:dihydropteroate synthase
VEEELARVLSVLPALVERLEVPISIDTQKPVVADVALAAGAIVLNDVSGLADLELATVAAQHGSHLVLTHNGWTMGRPAGEGDVIRGLHSLVDRAVHAGVEPDHLIVDPGLGFGKPPELSLALLRHMGELCTRLAPLPVLVGPSRKGFIGHVLGLPANDRLEGSLACVAIAALGGASMVRVHDVKPCTRAARMGWAIRGRPRPPK